MEKIKLRKLKNVRDISYGNIKPKRLIRGEALLKLPKGDKNKLLNEYNLKIVIDLRTSQEHADKPDIALEGVENIHIPLITMEEMGASSEKEGKQLVVKNHALPDIYDYYRKMVTQKRKDDWTKLFDYLINNKEGSILIHCTAGKDRSGVATAIILSALGIDKETIYQDYLLTNENPVVPFSYKMFALSLDKKTRKEFMNYFKANEEYLDAAFDYIDELYGNMDNFLKDICGLSEEKRKQLKANYLK